jgi:hypothetical protein
VVVLPVLDGEDGRASRLRSELGGEGLDGVFFSRSRVLFVLLEVLSVVSFYLEVLLAICNPTGII